MGVLVFASKVLVGLVLAGVVELVVLLPTAEAVSPGQSDLARA